MDYTEEDEGVGHSALDVITDEPLYIYSEEDDMDGGEEEYHDLEDLDLDNSAYNYSQVPDDLDEEDNCETTTGTLGGWAIFGILLKILSNPIEGWKEVRRRHLHVEDVQRNCFYPLLAVMAISYFAALFYSSRVTLTQIILQSVTSFVGYFAGYFIIILLLQLLLPKMAKDSVDTDFGKVFVIFNLSSLCLFFTAMQLLPMLWPILIFLPLWTVYVICRGTRFFKFPEDKMILCVGLMCLLIIGVPSLIEWGLSEILPVNS